MLSTGRTHLCDTLNTAPLNLMSEPIIAQDARLIVVVAFSRADNDELMPMRFDIREEAVRMACCLTAKCAEVPARSRKVQPDIAAFGLSTALFPCSEVAGME